MKGMITMYLDVDVIEWLRTQKNYSGMANLMFRNIMLENKNVENEQKIEELEAEINKKRALIAMENKQIIEKIAKKDQMIKEKEQKDLEISKKIIEKKKSLQKCMVCGSSLENRRHQKYKRGNVCYNCISAASKKEERMWDEE
jgi:uncharacterized paraquat-inducible protein A